MRAGQVIHMHSRMHCQCWTACWEGSKGAWPACLTRLQLGVVPASAFAAVLSTQGVLRSTSLGPASAMQLGRGQADADADAGAAWILARLLGVAADESLPLPLLCCPADLTAVQQPAWKQEAAAAAAAPPSSSSQASRLSWQREARCCSCRSCLAQAVRMPRLMMLVLMRQQHRQGSRRGPQHHPGDQQWGQQPAEVDD